MIGLGKIEKFHEMGPGWKLWLGVVFTDGLWAAELTPEVLEGSTEAKGGRRDRGRPEYRQYMFIPMDKFTRVEGSHSSILPHGGSPPVSGTPQSWRKPREVVR